MILTFDDQRPLRAIQVYAIAIQAMYDLAQLPFLHTIREDLVEEIHGVDIRLVFISNPVPASQTMPLKAAHCVAALYRGVNVMTDGVIFCSLRCQMLIHDDKVGVMIIAPIKLAPHAGAHGIDDDKVERDARANDDTAAVAKLGVDNGEVEDAGRPGFVIKFHFLGKPIQNKEVFLVILEALTMAAPFSGNSDCEEYHVVSPDGSTAIIIDRVESPITLTYGWATRALKLLYQEIITPTRKFGDIYLELFLVGQKFGELRMLNILGARNSTAAKVEEQ
ncbi:MAG: hypothetical protein L6R40_008407 [Gallowayella cf. fulva]|nr:MAG: hypothetical protein L6R40_008407 [Xanthomendoza cf. fulva]